jgi:hypothetical protein
LLPEIEEALENSLSLYPVDLVDLSTASDSFRRRELADQIYARLAAYADLMVRWLAAMETSESHAPR